MRGIIDYRPERQQYVFYLGGNGAYLHREVGDTTIQTPKAGEDILPYIKMSAEDYAALRDAILERESPRLAEAALLKEMLEDARDVRDRLLTLVERDS